MVDEDGKIPQHLGDFQILRELGRGGMGIVYEARQRSLSRRVALKVLSTGLGLTPRAVDRFRREAEAAAKLHHTNIVPVYATGEQNQFHYYAMELVEGPSLDQVIRQMRDADNPQPASDSTDAIVHRSSSEIPAWVAKTMAHESPKTDGESTGKPNTSTKLSRSGSALGAKYFDTVAAMIAEVADALDHAHNSGVIHRDVKPSNLLLSPDGKLSVNDFGLARVLEQPGMTMTGEFVGTPLYMSPEQITAGRAPLDHRTDIYSLGATLYELLTLQPPFSGRSRDEVIAQILHKDPKAPRRVRRTVPTDLETICLKAIERDPDRRYQTAGQLATDLRNYVNRFAITAKRTGPLGHVVKYARRHPANSALSLLVLLVVVLLAVAAFRLRANQKQNELERLQTEVVEVILRGDFSGAQKLREAARDLGASHYWDRFTDGQIQFYRGDYGEAIDRLEDALELEPESIPAKSLLAISQLWGGNESAYWKQLKAVENESATTFEDFLYLGYANAWMYPENALVLFNKAEQVHPNHNIVRLFRAQANRFYAMMLGDTQITEALNHVQEAVRESSVSMQILKDAPLANAEFALSSLAASNICRRFADKATETRDQHLRDSERYREQARGELDRLKKFSGSFDAKNARFLVLADNGDETGMRQLISELDIRDGEQNPYLFQIAGMGLFGLGDPEARLWMRSTPGLQGENCEFMEFFMEICNHEFSPEASDIDNRVRRCIDKKIAGSNPAYLEFDWCVVTLLNDVEYRRKTAEAAVRLNMFDHYDTIYAYLRGDAKESPRELLKRCSDDRRLLSEASFFLGVEALSQGKRDDARSLFNQCLEAGLFHFYAHWWSRAFLAQMDRVDKWPTWTPMNESP